MYIYDTKDTGTKRHTDININQDIGMGSHTRYKHEEERHPYVMDEVADIDTQT